MSGIVKESDWWQSFYEETPFELLLTRKDPLELELTLDFLWKNLSIRAGGTVFDQCCGSGSLSIPLAQKGAKMISVDLCAKYIASATNDNDALGLPGRFYCADAFEFATDTPCDAAFNWWTSFGYSPDDSRNMRMLEKSFASLRAGGRFALDYPNMPGVLRGFKDREVSSYDTEGGEVQFIRETHINLMKGLREQLWTFVLPDGRNLAHETSLRIYLPHTLVEMLRTCGFVDVELYGSVEENELTLDSPRCICIARRPES